jgi:hypothetical protein
MRGLGQRAARMSTRSSGLEWPGYSKRVGPPCDGQGGGSRAGCFVGLRAIANNTRIILSLALIRRFCRQFRGRSPYRSQQPGRPVRPDVGRARKTSKRKYSYPINWRSDFAILASRSRAAFEMRRKCLCYRGFSLDLAMLRRYNPRTQRQAVSFACVGTDHPFGVF